MKIQQVRVAVELDTLLRHERTNGVALTMTREPAWAALGFESVCFAEIECCYVSGESQNTRHEVPILSPVL